MLIEFALQNFKSFKELGVLSLEGLPKEKEDTDMIRAVVKDRLNILKTKAIFGANASGKSNLILGMVGFWKLVDGNLKDDSLLDKWYHPHRMDAESVNKPVYFQVIFEHGGDRYRYGFEFGRLAIHSEWLYVKRKPLKVYAEDGSIKLSRTKEVMLFEREGDSITELNETGFAEGKILKSGIKMFTDQTLAIAVLDQLSAPISSLVRDYIVTKVSISVKPPSMEGNMWHHLTISLFEKDVDFRNWTLKLLHEIDNSIVGSEIKTIQLANQELKVPVVLRKGAEADVPFILRDEEAAGTNKMFDYASVIYRSLREGKTLVIDEMDALLHPKLTKKIIELFQSADSHEGAQLIFATHDTNLMDSELLRRDQITFVEKSTSGVSEIFDLSDIKGVRAKDLFEKNYLKGNYGALPYLNKLETVLLNGK